MGPCDRSRVQRHALRALAALLLLAGCATTPPAGNLSDGERAYLEGRHTDAELIWLEQLAEAEAYGEDDPRLAQALCMLSNLQIQEQRYDEAKPLLERWIAIRERQGLTMDGQFADGVEAQAGIHAVKGEPALALHH